MPEVMQYIVTRSEIAAPVANILSFQSFSEDATSFKAVPCALTNPWLQKR